MKYVLVTYATRAGSTVEVARMVGAAFSEHGCAVDVVPVASKPPVAGYDAVIVGSAIRMGKWLPEAIEFLEENQHALAAMPVALFTVHMNNRTDEPESKANREAYLDAVRPLVKPVSTAFFAGAIDPQRLNFLDRMIVKVVHAPEGDYRDWEAIHDWAEEIVTAAVPS
jgi:menaquinone-dependent protoporphyrinogen oxidase